MNVKSKQDRVTALKLLLEGNSLRGTARLTGFERNTCSRIMIEFGHRCGRFLDRQLRNLTLEQVQVDELFNVVGMHPWTAKRVLEVDDPRVNRVGRMAFYVAYAVGSKLIPVHRVGPLCQQTTYQFIYDLRNRLKLPQPDEMGDVGEVKPIIMICSDKRTGYKKPIQSIFGPLADYGRLKKKIIKKKGEHKKWDIKPEVVQGEFAKEEISTSLVERANLNIRTFMAPMRRKSLTFAKKLENLQAAANVYLAHYNFCWPHRYEYWDEQANKKNYYISTPALEVGIAPKRYSLEEFYDLVHQHTIPLWEDFDE